MEIDTWFFQFTVCEGKDPLGTPLCCSSVIIC